MIRKEPSSSLQAARSLECLNNDDVLQIALRDALR